MLDEAGVDRERVLGAGMALAGPVDHERGALHPSPILSGWADVDAAAEVERHIGIPVHLDNDANLGALGGGHARRRAQRAHRPPTCRCRRASAPA